MSAPSSDGTAWWRGTSSTRSWRESGTTIGGAATTTTARAREEEEGRYRTGEGEVGGRGGGKQIYPPSPDPGTKKVGEKRYIKEFYIIYI